MPVEEPRRMPSTLGGAIYFVVILTGGLGLLVVAFGPWRRGVALMGFGLILAAVVRAVLSDHDSGMLRVRRSRVVDVLMLGATGIALIVLASVIPDQGA